MKKHLLFVLILVLTVPCMAQVTIRPKQGGHHPQSTSLTIAAPRGVRFWLYVNDVLQNEQPTRSVCVNGFDEDRYYVRVELDNTLQNCVGQYVDMRQSQTLSIVQDMKLFGLGTTEAHIRPELSINLLTAPPFTPEPPTIVPSMPSATYGMKPHDYDEACLIISNESFDNTKLTLAKQIITSNPMTARQIADICKLFSFESNKLEFAKYAYGHCVDTNRYFLLNDVFSYDSTKHELDEYLKGLQE